MTCPKSHNWRDQDSNLGHVSLNPTVFLPDQSTHHHRLGVQLLALSG